MIGDRAAIVFAFVGSGCLLILEIVAGRLLAPELGVSLYTWTSVIGVVLAGLAIGNFFGGRLADRRPDRSTLALIYVAGSLGSLAILGLVHVIDSIQLPSGAPAIVQVLWLTAVLFLVPSALLAASTPVLTRLCLRSVEEGGRVVGRIQAAAALGSIAGTFLTGFLLVSSFGTRWVVAGVALTMLLLAIAARPPWLRGRVFELGSLLVLIVTAGWSSHSGCLRESNYYCIKVEDVSTETVTENGVTRNLVYARALYLDKLLHGVANLKTPNDLFYEYERLYARAISLLHPADSRVDAFFVGGGAYTFPGFVERAYRGRIVVAEIDSEVTRTARELLGLTAVGALRDPPRRRPPRARVDGRGRSLRLRPRRCLQRLRGSVSTHDAGVQRPRCAAPEAERALPAEHRRWCPLRLSALGGADAPGDVPVRRRDAHALLATQEG